MYGAIFKWIAKICLKVEKGLKIKAATKCILKSLKISLVALLMFLQKKEMLILMLKCTNSWLKEVASNCESFRKKNQFAHPCKTHFS